jgi:branched-chain amino acid transport system ATP-binding protein
MTLLQTRNLTRQYGGVRAVNDVSFALERGEIRGVIGPNGAGKTTLVGMICGRVLPSAGSVQFDGADITRMQPWDRVARGIVYTFQITSVFKRLTAATTSRWRRSGT